MNWESSSRKLSGKTKEKRWLPTFVSLNYLLSGHYYHDYQKTLLSLTNGLSETSFLRLISWCSEQLEDFFQLKLKEARDEIKKEGKHLDWKCSGDGFYHIRGHHSNNSSAALIDLETNKVLFASHACKIGKTANYSGDSFLIPELIPLTLFFLKKKKKKRLFKGNGRIFNARLIHPSKTR